jgi:hypothetical protein
MGTLYSGGGRNANIGGGSVKLQMQAGD